MVKIWKTTRVAGLRRQGRAVCVPAAALCAVALCAAVPGSPDRISAVPSPRAIAADPQGAPYLAGADGTIVHVLDVGLADRFTAFPGNPSGLAFDAQGTMYVADAARRAILTVAPSGAVTLLADRCNGRPFLAPSHITAAPGGVFYLTDTGASAIFRVNGRGQVSMVRAGIESPRGVAASADGTWLFVAGGGNTIWKISSDGTNASRFAVLDGEGVASGMAIDETGSLYVARDGGGAVSVVSAGGAALPALHTSGRRVVDVAFGGPEMKTLYAVESDTGALTRFALSHRAQRLPWEPDPRFRIVQPVDGAILNRHDGVPETGGLRIDVRGDALGAQTVLVNGAAVPVRDGHFATTLVLRQRETAIRVQYGGETREAKVLWDRDSFPRYRLSLDDNIWFLRDIAENADRYHSLFDNPYLAFWRDIHSRYGTKVHINLYYETDGFNLSRMPDKFRDEWRRNADWIRLSFHARANDPDRPYLHASPEQLLSEFRFVMREIERFAGKELIAPVTTVHWGAATRPAVRALRREGIRTLVGYFEPHGDSPLVSYYLPFENWQYLGRRDYWKDNSEDLLYVKHDMVINLYKPEQIVPRLEEIAADPHQSEIIELMIHEQYFYPGYVNYEPDYRERVERAIQWVSGKGYKPVFFSDGFLGTGR